MKNISIVVIGGCGCGKSAVALLIQKALIEAGILTTLQDDNGIGIIDEAPGIIESSLNSRLETIGETTKVAVHTLQSSRPFSLIGRDISTKQHA